MNFYRNKTLFAMLCCVALLLLAIGCRTSNDEAGQTAVAPTPTLLSKPTSAVPADRDFIVIATDAPNPPFTNFDQFGNISGYLARIMAEIAATAQLDYEFVATPYDGVLENMTSGGRRDFDAVMTNLAIAEAPPEGIAYTLPYLEVGQVMVVLADQTQYATYHDVQPGTAVGVAQDSWGEEAARTVANISDADLVTAYSNSVQALQGLINEEVTAVIIDSYTADYYAQTYPDRLRIIGGNGRDTWISSRAYAIALAASDTLLLDRLNQAITDAQTHSALDRIVVELIPSDTLQPGEPRAGTAADQLVIGVLGTLDNLDPAAEGDFIAQELKNNTMSGLYRFNAANELEPLLARALPQVSANGLEYTISLQPDLLFTDGSELKAEDVKWSVERSRSLGNFLVNGYLKDVDGNGFADDDAVQIVDEYTVKFVLQAPIGYFPSLLATPAYFPISSDCYALTLDAQSDCGGIGPYTIDSWVLGESIVLKANADWPGRPSPAFETIVVRLFEDVPSLRRSLERFQSIDIAWTGLPYADVQALAEIADSSAAGFRIWEGSAVFKSYLIFDHDTAPWDRAKVRQAANYALDRPALAALFNGSRQPLLSPVPSTVPGYTAVYPPRNLPTARTLLLEEGYSQANPAEVTLWLVNDGRYSNIEQEYAEAIKAQLEETGAFQVTLASADSTQFRSQISVCGYPAYLIGWPTPGSPTDDLDVTSWTQFFVENTDSGFCSNYENPAMTALFAAAEAETETAARLALYADIQRLWVTDLPTLDLLEEHRFAVSLPTVDNVVIDALGLMRYEFLTKSE